MIFATPRSLQEQAVRFVSTIDDFGVGADVAPALPHRLSHRLAYEGEVHDAGVGHPQPGYAHRVRLALANLVGRQPGDPRQPIGFAAALEFLQPGQLLLPGGDDDLAAPFVGDVVLPAKAVHRLAPLDAQARLGAVRFVVKPGVDHAAVVSGLVGGQAVLGFQHGHGHALASAQRHRGR